MTDPRGIYRGPGGPGDATADTSNESIIAVAAAAAAESSKNAAAASASAAAASAASAATSSSNASTQATNAASSAAAASISASSAATSVTNAQTAETNAETAEANAEIAQAAAELAESNAQAYELSANEWATKTSGPVAGGEYSAKYNAQLAAISESNASSSASSASSSAASASSSASTATTKAAEAATSASNASTSATNAAASASTATTKASEASSSASAAATSASNAATSETNAANSASSANTSEVNAASSASSAASSASSASSSATAASAAQSAAETARDQTLAAYDNFDDRYLGAKTSDPSVDNDGNTLIAGALYFNSSLGYMKVYTGTIWVDAYAAGTSFLAKANNLSDLPSVSSARSNLGLGTAATTASTDYATAAQGTKADTAYGWGNHALAGYLTSLGIGSLTQAYDSNLTSFVSTFTLPTTDGSNGQVLGTNGSGTLSFVTPSTVGSIDDLSDVVITSPTTDQVLKYNGTSWVNSTAAGGATKLVITVRAGTTTDVLLANGVLPVVNRAGSTISVTVN